MRLDIRVAAENLQVRNEVLNIVESGNAGRAQGLLADRGDRDGGLFEALGAFARADDDLFDRIPRAGRFALGRVGRFFELPLSQLGLCWAPSAQG